jgi:hypothetical protein
LDSEGVGGDGFVVGLAPAFVEASMAVFFRAVGGVDPVAHEEVLHFALAFRPSDDIEHRAQEPVPLRVKDVDAVVCLDSISPTPPVGPQSCRSDSQALDRQLVAISHLKTSNATCRARGSHRSRSVWYPCRCRALLRSPTLRRVPVPASPPS